MKPIHYALGIGILLLGITFGALFVAPTVSFTPTPAPAVQPTYAPQVLAWDDGYQVVRYPFERISVKLFKEDKLEYIVKYTDGSTEFKVQSERQLNYVDETAITIVSWSPAQPAPTLQPVGTPERFCYDRAYSNPEYNIIACALVAGNKAYSACNPLSYERICP